MTEKAVLTEKDSALWDSFLAVVKEDLANKIKGAVFEVTMEVEYAKLDDVDAFHSKLKKVKIKGKENGLFDIKKTSDRFVVHYAVDGRN